MPVHGLVLPTTTCMVSAHPALFRPMMVYSPAGILVYVPVVLEGPAFKLNENPSPPVAVTVIVPSAFPCVAAVEIPEISKFKSSQFTGSTC